MLDDGIRMLAYFHKDSVASCKEIQTDYNKEDCDDWKRLKRKKKIMIIEKDCHDWNGLWLKKCMFVIRWIQ